jgi:hypothetical protein
MSDPDKPSRSPQEVQMSEVVVAASNHLRTEPRRAPFRPRILDRRRTLARLRTRTERGAATAEYAVTIVAACGLGGILVALLKSPVMMNALKALINYALKIAGVDGVHL